jgi:3-dehydroquinate dehydratase type II
MKLYIINGPNINMLGIREPELYGKESYEALVRITKEHAEKCGFEPVFFQSNHEGALVDKIQEAFFEGAFGIVINPAAYTHTSIALLDAVKATRLPTVEVHISDVDSRESYRRTSYIREAVLKTVSGEGLQGYLTAIDFLKDLKDEG